MKLSIVPIMAGVALASLMTSASAHHSTAMFAWGTEVEMKNATVERWEWTNPHTFLYVSVPKAGGGTERWAFEGMSPSSLARAGWSKNSLKPGDKVDLGYYALKDDRKGGFNVAVTFPDGRTIRQLPHRAPASAAGTP